MASTLEGTIQQTLFEVTNTVREFIQGAQNWQGKMPLAISHCFLELEESCGGFVEITGLEDWTRYLSLRCFECNKDFKVYYSDFGLAEVIV